jgi:hypothetical protein
MILLVYVGDLVSARMKRGCDLRTPFCRASFSSCAWDQMPRAFGYLLPFGCFASQALSSRYMP